MEDKEGLKFLGGAGGGASVGFATWVGGGSAGTTPFPVPVAVDVGTDTGAVRVGDSVLPPETLGKTSLGKDETYIIH